MDSESPIRFATPLVLLIGLDWSSYLSDANMTTFACMVRYLQLTEDIPPSLRTILLGGFYNVGE